MSKLKEPIDCNDWECIHNKNGKCWATSDDCPDLIAFFENRRKLFSNTNKEIEK